MAETKKTRRACFIMLFVSFLNILPSQNLVSNGGFEEMDKDGSIGWENTAWSPDFFGSNREGLWADQYKERHCGTPIGKAFLGLMTTEVTSTKLISTLKKDKDYLVKIFVQKPISFCPGGITKISVAFTEARLPKKEGPKVNSYYNIPFLDLYSEDLKPLKEKCKWVEFSAVYRANGSENFFHIGQFGANKAPDPGKEIIHNDTLPKTVCMYVHYDSVVVEELVTGDDNPMVLEGVYFETNKSTVLAASYVALDKLYAFAVKCPNYKIKVSGHTDNVGDKTKNFNLSKQRAASVVAYLVKKGISQNRLLSAGWGDTKPIANNTTEEGKAKNRRVEIVLLK